MEGRNVRLAYPAAEKTYLYGAYRSHWTYTSHGPEGGVGTTSSRGLAE